MNENNACMHDLIVFFLFRFTVSIVLRARPAKLESCRFGVRASTRLRQLQLGCASTGIDCAVMQIVSLTVSVVDSAGSAVGQLGLLGYMDGCAVC